MNRLIKVIRDAGLLTIAVSAMFLFLCTVAAHASIQGISGTAFNLTAKTDHISTPDGNSLLIWGYADDGGMMGRAQYPGPTLILNQGDTITINLSNELAMPVSMVFPGHVVTTSGGAQGLLTAEAPVGGTVTYTFTAANPGTYLYHSGTHPELQVEMGLLGAIIVRPTGFDAMNPRAYNHPDSSYDREYLFLLTEMDPRINEVVQFLGAGALSDTDYLDDYFPNYWFINGRNAPDTMAMENVHWLPTQPYNCMPMMEPGEKLLMRIIDAGRDLHPYHFHGNHARVIARDGRMLGTAPAAGADLSYRLFTITAIPGETVDAIFEWTGERLGWDIYGTGPGYEHECMDMDGDDFDDMTWEYCPDHGKPFPVFLPEGLSVTFGGMWSGSPFMGTLGSLPPGQGGLNPYGGFTYMWHSHNEKEMTNYDIFPGGSMTMLIVVPPGAMDMK